jgi:hypothetical protein
LKPPPVSVSDRANQMQLLRLEFRSLLVVAGIVYASRIVI